MKNRWWKLCVMAALCGFALFAGGKTVMAAEQEPPGRGDRVQQLERRLNELAERQEQMMRQFGNPREAQMRRQFRPPQGPLEQMPGPRPENLRRPLAAAGAPAPMPAKPHSSLQDLAGLLFICALIFNILLAVWIFTDIRKRGEGSGIFIALALVAGIPAAIIYTLVRIGDRREAPKESK